MPRLLTLLLLLTVACDPDADSDGVPKSLDCDDGNAARFPGNDEICDEIDNDCDTRIDNDAIDRIASYADVDKDTFGSPLKASLACVVPPGYVTNDQDCDDRSALIQPNALEICNGGVDDDCDSLIDDADDSLDTSTGSTFWMDADSDGFGDFNNPVGACVQPDGTVGNSEDCDDDDDAINPDGVEICDGVDNDCDDIADSGLVGDEEICAAATCLDVAMSGDGDGDKTYWIDPVGGAPFQAFCDLTTDGGGWTLIGWTAESAKTTASGFSAGVPYPGLAVCASLDCERGSSAPADQLQALMRQSTELAAGHSPDPLKGFQPLGSYDYASTYVYQDLSKLELVQAITWDCSAEQLTTGRHKVLVGPTDYDGAEVTLPIGLIYASSLIDELNEYIWNIAGEPDPCAAEGAPPAVYLGTQTGLAGGYGPYLGPSAGARAAWAR